MWIEALLLNDKADVNNIVSPWYVLKYNVNVYGVHIFASYIMPVPVCLGICILTTNTWWIIDCP